MSTTAKPCQTVNKILALYMHHAHILRVLMWVTRNTGNAKCGTGAAIYNDKYAICQTSRVTEYAAA